MFTRQLKKTAQWITSPDAILEDIPFAAVTSLFTFLFTASAHFLSEWSDLLFSSVQDGSYHSMRSENPICVPPCLSEVSPTSPLKRFQCSSDWRWPSLVLWRKIVQRFLFPCLSPPGNRWGDVVVHSVGTSIDVSSPAHDPRCAGEIRYWGIVIKKRTKDRKIF